MSASELPSFLAVAGFESEIGMAMFVQLLGDEATFRDTHGTEAQDAGTNRPIRRKNMKQTWRGPSAFRIEAGEAKILIDPFLSDNPSRDNGWSRCLTGKNSTQGGDR